jgi:hypothetical protein
VAALGELLVTLFASASAGSQARALAAVAGPEATDPGAGSVARPARSASAEHLSGRRDAIAHALYAPRASCSTHLSHVAAALALTEAGEPCEATAV